jgi:hypothetical protein
MTPLTRPVRRQLDIVERGRPLVVKVAREGIYIRRRGEREYGPACYLLPWSSVYFYACARTVQERKKEAAKAKRQRADERRERNRKPLKVAEP